MTIEGRTRDCWSCQYFVNDDTTDTLRGGACLRHAPTKIDQNNGVGSGGIGGMTQFAVITDATIEFCGEYVPATIPVPAIPDLPPEE